ncbi:uncharacterized protein LOC126900785 isoform X2 [Daktulosphaira vitifoliae]|uniref:uncharacterized protein LOC126900785 isoform X2 n=1 Tax=Daktulosphaira vitifoliae TaxID=58002 RepID=UPI0021A98C20|nr:uncharacterized protein LOC126900785 isoform X2 [Daktulosphaira vitifoliae]
MKRFITMTDKKCDNQNADSKKCTSNRMCDQEKNIITSVIDDYNPWGKPGHGAPNTDGLRKRKIFTDPPSPPLQRVSNEVTTMGRPGGGAPLKSSSGKTKNFVVEDPQLRFQFHAPDRNIVDNDFRYRKSLKDQRAYKIELDEMVRKKQEIINENRKREIIKDKQLGYEDGSMMIVGLGSTDSTTKESDDIDIITGGVELAPILARRRRQEIKWPLHSSDVTKIYDPKSNFLIDEKEYHEFLDRQISGREKRKQHDHEEELQKGQKHYQRWQEFWGKPGGGAPKGSIKQKENLDYILYQLPVINRMKEKEERNIQNNNKNLSDN